MKRRTRKIVRFLREVLVYAVTGFVFMFIAQHLFPADPADRMPADAAFMFSLSFTAGMLVVKGLKAGWQKVKWKLKKISDLLFP